MLGWMWESISKIFPKHSHYFEFYSLVLQVLMMAHEVYLFKINCLLWQMIRQMELNQNNLLHSIKAKSTLTRQDSAIKTIFKKLDLGSKKKQLLSRLFWENFNSLLNKNQLTWQSISCSAAPSFSTYSSTNGEGAQEIWHKMK